MYPPPPHHSGKMAGFVNDGYLSGPFLLFFIYSFIFCVCLQN